MSMLKIKKGDTVKVIAGKDKDKEGKVIAVNQKTGKVIVEGVNMLTKHTKPSAANQNGGIVHQEGYIDASNVMLLHNGKATRVGFKMDGDKKVRVCAKCGASYHIVNKPSAKEGVCDRCGGELAIRKDDEPATVLDRLKAYHEQTEPLVEFYRQRGKLVEVPDQGSIEATTAFLLKLLEA